MLSVPVGQLLSHEARELQLRQVAGGERGLERRIASSRIQKPGLVLVGHPEGLHAERLAVFGNTEMTFAATLDEGEMRQATRILVDAEVASLVITKEIPVPDVMQSVAEEEGLALLSTPLLSSAFIARVTRYLEDALAPTTSVHGVLMDVLGVGILLLGKSGIGKSEAALELVLRGHRVVADDIIDIKRRGRTLYGQPSDIIKHHMEIRGLGIINVKDLFGIAAVRDRKKIELVVELVEWDPSDAYDRLGIEEKTFEILDEHVHEITVPVRPGRSMTTIIEVAARNHLLKIQGHHSARQFQEKLDRAIADAGFAPQRSPGDDVE